MSPKDWVVKKELYNYFDSQKTMDFDIFNKLNKYKKLAIGEKGPVEFFARMGKDEFVSKAESVEAEDLKGIIPFRIGNNTSFHKVVNRERDAQRAYKNKGW